MDADDSFLQEADRVKLIVEIYDIIMMMCKKANNTNILSLKSNSKATTTTSTTSPSNRPKSPTSDDDCTNKKEKHYTIDDKDVEMDDNVDTTHSDTKDTESIESDDEESASKELVDNNLDTPTYDKNILERMSMLLDHEISLLSKDDILVFLRHCN